MTETKNNESTSQIPAFIIQPLIFIWKIIKSFAVMLQSLLFLLFKTPYILFPSVAHSSINDDDYNRRLEGDLRDTVGNLSDLDSVQKEILVQNWIDQISWTNKRATRERDANEVVRWWQIILGVLIPVLANIIGNPSLAKDVITVLGVLLAILTGIYQFRRPEERWRHYRTLHELYLNELWDYISLSGTYADKDKKGHSELFAEFNSNMMRFRREEVTQFFGDVLPYPNKRINNHQNGAAGNHLATGE